ncbi:hypothetical protein TNCV_2711951 [Trichonephila clavipes]|nr:hypothetical protein TNCV_2711951 [Trichonephila clavipes]
MYIKSTTCYSYVRDKGNIILSSVRQAASGLNVTPGLSTLANENYLRGRCKELKDHEKQVILQIDEIFIKSAITYKCNKIIGFTERGEAATTIQCFLYSSLMSKNKEIVSLNPVKKVNAEDLYSMTLEILSPMEKWLDCWKNLKQNKREGCLSEETFFALRHTVNTIPEVIKYLLTEQNFKYVLTGKFQTDNLEARFGANARRKAFPPFVTSSKLCLGLVLQDGLGSAYRAS